MRRATRPAGAAATAATAIRARLSWARTARSRSRSHAIGPAASSRRSCAKGQTRLDGFDDKIISLYARGLTVREIQGHLKEIYGTEVSPDLISRVTDAVLEEVREWQSRPLDPVYPVVFFDALRVKIRDEGLVKNKAVYVALALNAEGEKEVLGLWIEQTEGAKFWLKVMNDLKTRGVNDILIAVVDGLKGFPEAIGSVFPQTIGADLHRSPDPQFAWPSCPGRIASDHARPEGDLPGRNAEAAADPARRVRGRMGQAVPGDRPGVGGGPGSTSFRSSPSRPASAK